MYFTTANRITFSNRLSGSSLIFSSDVITSGGRMIIRFKQDGIALKVFLDNVDITNDASQNTIGGTWEDKASNKDGIYFNKFKRSGLNLAGDSKIHSIIRIGDVLTTGEAMNLYNYLNAKY